MRDDAQAAPGQGPHPLALRLAALLPVGARVLVLGPGRGRSLPPFEARGCALEIASEVDALHRAHGGPFDGILSTHVLLHGTKVEIVRRVGLLAQRLGNEGRLFATFGSKTDTRYARGVYVAGDGWQPVDGDEAGVTHAYFDRVELEQVFDGFVEVQITSRDVRAVVGSWAHSADDPEPRVHWFVEARRSVPERYAASGG